jgi:hypothetical protein
MKKDKTSTKQKETTNVEFGIEFGDLNAGKLYETLFMSKKGQNSKKK